VRAFVAVDVPSPDVGTGLTPGSPTHLTLAFLGEVADDRVPELVAAVRDGVGAAAPFELVLAGTGAFPSRSHPRIVFADIGEGRAALEAIAGTVRAALTAHRFGFDGKPFVPHLTLLRVRGLRDVPLARRLLDTPPGRELGRHRVGELLLKSSELGPGGARHRVVARYPLVGASPRAGEPGTPPGDAR